MRHRYGPGDGCRNVARPCQQHPNPAPGSSPQAAAAAKADAAKRNDSSSTLSRMLKKLVPTPSATPASTQSAGAIADRRDQEAKLKNE